MVVLSYFELPALHELIEVVLRVGVLIFLETEDVGGQHLAVDVVEIEHLYHWVNQGVQENHQVDHLKQILAVEAGGIGQHAHQKNIEIEVDVERVLLSLGETVPVAPRKVGLGLN